MQIAIIGAGNVGGALGPAWEMAGHRVRYGVPNPADPKYAGLGAGNLAAPRPRRRCGGSEPLPAGSCSTAPTR